MSFDILQQPTNPNIAQTPLVYSVSSSNAGQPQFRYVFTVAHQYGDLRNVQQVKVYPNMTGIGTVDLSTIASSLTFQNAPNLSEVSLSTINGLEVDYGEEYAPDFNTPTAYYYRGTLADLELLGGYKNINDNTDTGYNFDSGSYAIVSGSTDKSILSNNPYTFKIGSQPEIKRYVPRDVSVGHVYTIQQYGTSLDVTVMGYDSSDTILSLDTISYSVSPTDPDRYYLTRVGTGIPLSPTQYPNLAANWSSVAYFDFIIGGTDEISRYYLLDQCEYDTTTFFTWMNEFGVYDTYFVSNPIRRTSNISRYDYDRTFVRYEDSNSSYNINNRGKRQYLTEYDYTYEVTTDWLNQKEANWLSGMFESNNVVIFQPKFPLTSLKGLTTIEIINSSYEVNNSTSRNKLFQYTVQYKQSLQLQER